MFSRDYTPDERAFVLAVLQIARGDVTTAQQRVREQWGATPDRWQIHYWRARECEPDTLKNECELRVSERLHVKQRQVMEMTDADATAALRDLTGDLPQGVTLREALDEVGGAEIAERFLSKPPVTARSPMPHAWQLLFPEPST